ncbi:MAG TPA: DUF2922 domain-containing protein [Thermotogae bacterium]|nr:DUF2922 domain-containing protein [Thermotogota bacterium]
MAKVLNLVFRDSAAGRSRRITVSEPRTDLTATEVQNAMNALKSKNAVAASYEVDQATIVDRVSNELFDLL